MTVPVNSGYALPILTKSATNLGQGLIAECGRGRPGAGGGINGGLIENTIIGSMFPEPEGTSGISLGYHTVIGGLNIWEQGIAGYKRFHDGVLGGFGGFYAGTHYSGNMTYSVPITTITNTNPVTVTTAVPHGISASGAFVLIDLVPQFNGINSMQLGAVATGPDTLTLPTSNFSSGVGYTQSSSGWLIRVNSDRPPLKNGCLYGTVGTVGLGPGAGISITSEASGGFASLDISTGGGFLYGGYTIFSQIPHFNLVYIEAALGLSNIMTFGTAGFWAFTSDINVIMLSGPRTHGIGMNRPGQSGGAQTGQYASGPRPLFAQNYIAGVYIGNWGGAYPATDPPFSSGFTGSIP